MTKATAIEITMLAVMCQREYIIITIIIFYLLTGTQLVNVNFSEGWRQRNTDVAQPLRYKASFLINHIREQTLKAASEINSSMVSTTESDGIFTVQSSNSSSTYTVDFSIPSCQCLQFKRTALPCKHFMGIFLHVDGWDWSCLPDSYKNSPYFNIDADCINGLLVDHPTTDDSFVMITEIPSKKPDENTGSLLFTDCNESTNRITKSAAADVRELLSSIRNLTYLVEYDKLQEYHTVA